MIITSGHVPLAPVIVTSACTGEGVGAGVGLGVGVGVVPVLIVIWDALKTISLLFGRVPVNISFVPA